MKKTLNKMDMTATSAKRNTNEVDMKEEVSTKDGNMYKHVSAIYRMHGVQEATKKRRPKNYNLVDAEFARVREKGHDPLLLQGNCTLVVKCIIRVLLQRCCTTKHGYDGKSASETVNALLSSVGMW